MAVRSQPIPPPILTAPLLVNFILKSFCGDNEPVSKEVTHRALDICIEAAKILKMQVDEEEGQQDSRTRKSTGIVLHDDETPEPNPTTALKLSSIFPEHLLYICEYIGYVDSIVSLRSASRLFQRSLFGCSIDLTQTHFFIWDDMKFTTKLNSLFELQFMPNANYLSQLMVPLDDDPAESINASHLSLADSSLSSSSLKHNVKKELHLVNEILKYLKSGSLSISHTLSTSASLKVHSSLKQLGFDYMWRVTGLWICRRFPFDLAMDIISKHVGQLNCIKKLGICHTSSSTIFAEIDKCSKRGLLPNLEEIVYLSTEVQRSNFIHYFDMDIDYFSEIVSLRKLSLYDQSTHQSFDSVCGDVDSLSKLHNLTYIDFFGLSSLEGDLSVFEYLSNLQYLDISQTNIEGDTCHLSKLYHLRYLNMDNVSIFGDVQHFCELTELTELSVVASIEGNIDGLSCLTKLQILEISGFSKLSGDIKSLSTLVNLSNLNFDDSIGLCGDLSSLKHLEKLCKVNIEHTDIKDKDNWQRKMFKRIYR
jgi:hypothetical protein